MTTTDIISTHLVVNVYEGYSQFFSGARQTSEMHIAQSSCVQSCYHSGSSWYRVWSDGHIEQGGLSPTIPGSGGATVTLLMPYSNTNYIVNLCNTSCTITQAAGLDGKTTTSFVVDYWSADLSGPVVWSTIGY
jgi:hypothetical protein